MWTEKYRPKGLEDLYLHKSISTRIARLAVDKANLPHLLFYGPPGAGKMTRINILLYEIFGPEINITQLYNTRVNSTTVPTVSSKCHVELNAFDFKNYADNIVRHVSSIHLPPGVPFRVIVIKDAHLFIEKCSEYDTPDYGNIYEEMSYHHVL